MTSTRTHTSTTTPISTDLVDIIGAASLRSRQTGLTMVELMITLAIAAILLTVAAPNLTDILANNAVAAQSDTFVSSLSLARAEAVKRGKSVNICKRSGTACSNTGDWEDGWIIYTDNDADGTLDAGEELQFFDALKSGYTLTPASTTNWLQFRFDGRVFVNSGSLSSAASTFRLCDPQADTTRSRTINLNAFGQIRVNEGTTACP